MPAAESSFHCAAGRMANEESKDGAMKLLKLPDLLPQGRPVHFMLTRAT
jgi:hypothetical protein